MARIKYTIEPSWTIHGYEGEIEIDDEDLEGLSPKERAGHITSVVEDVVNDTCPWGWEELDPTAEDEG
jgi:hypothetical protein